MKKVYKNPEMNVLTLAMQCSALTVGSMKVGGETNKLDAPRYHQYDDEDDEDDDEEW